MRKLFAIWAFCFLPALAFAELDSATITITNIGTNTTVITNTTASPVDGEIYGVWYDFSGTNTYTNTLVLSTVAGVNVPAVTVLYTTNSADAVYYPVVQASALYNGSNYHAVVKSVAVPNQTMQLTAKATETAAVTTNSHVKATIVFERK